MSFAPLLFSIIARLGWSTKMTKVAKRAEVIAGGYESAITPRGQRCLRSRIGRMKAATPAANLGHQDERLLPPLNDEERQMAYGRWSWSQFTHLARQLRPTVIRSTWKKQQIIPRRIRRARIPPSSRRPQVAAPIILHSFFTRDLRAMRRAGGQFDIPTNCEPSIVVIENRQY